MSKKKVKQNNTMSNQIIGTQQYNQLHPHILKYCAKHGWKSFTPIQSKMLIEWKQKQSGDIYLVTAPTASGKTEAVTFPIISELLYNNKHSNIYTESINVLYIAPLKALLNDLYARLTLLLKNTNIKVNLWHGDVNQSEKNNLLNHPENTILLTTPESLSSFLTTRHSWSRQHLLPEYIIIDEYHAFLDSSRGAQLISLVNMIDVLKQQSGQQPSIRIGLSATIGDPETIAKTLLWSEQSNIHIIQDNNNHNTSNTKIILNGLQTNELLDYNNQEFINIKNTSEYAKKIITQYDNKIMKIIIFAGSRARSELFFKYLIEHSPYKIFLHHGLLSKTQREQTEHDFKYYNNTCIMIATNTLELGIDIGDVNYVIQYGAPFSVSSFRQRIGRSGRRTGVSNGSILVPLDKPERIIQSIAILYLMDHNYFESGNIIITASIIIENILRLLTVYESGTVQEITSILFKIFPSLLKEQEKYEYLIDETIQCLYNKNYIIITNNIVRLDVKGQQEVSNYKFFTMFDTSDGYNIILDKKTLGELILSTIDEDIIINQKEPFLFAGKTLQVVGQSKTSLTVKQVVSSAPHVIQGSISSNFIKSGAQAKIEALLKSEQGSNILKQLLKKYQANDILLTTLYNNYINVLRDIQYTKTGLHLWVPTDEKIINSIGEETIQEWIMRGYTLSDDCFISITPPLSLQGLAAFEAIMSNYINLNLVKIKLGEYENIPLSTLYNTINEILNNPEINKNDLPLFITEANGKYDHLIPDELRAQFIPQYNIQECYKYLAALKQEINNLTT